MTSLKTQQKREIAIHVGIWVTILLLPYLISSADEGYKIGGLPAAFFVLAGLIHAGIFYFNAFYLYPKLARGWRWWLYIPCAIAVIMVSFALKYQIVAHFFPEVVLRSAAGLIFGPSVLVFAASLVYRRVSEGIQKERARKEYEAQQVAAELKLLRSQVNPHFLFNVLTNMVALARQRSDQLEDALLRLADLMRYMTYDTQAKQVTLQQETDYLKSYIELQKLRFSDGMRIELDVQMNADAGSLPVEPMIMIPFVENAFKHGASRLDEPYVLIRLKAIDGLLTLTVVNPYDADPEVSNDDNSGIGLENVRTRLKLIYPDKHTFAIDDRNSIFTITLNLNLR
ncbi:sensor histidine kinase [Dyadobacter jiangsuensis]|uniref:Histidine kinase n=1 Tax=Dyadobacter jiangsuensis TaxID=1591085 RepID=A0A2P8FNA1_9BACT|nr:histidine kinase [Dyadobacter jiangsuensis]PSL23135.1 histidine kinase [Dyadobacter jiangsuensis]